MSQFIQPDEDEEDLDPSSSPLMDSSCSVAREELGENGVEDMVNLV